jgi:hypothetical protein
MKLIQEVEISLQERDGFCRDINFAFPTKQGATNLVGWFCQNYMIHLATTGAGIDVTSELADCNYDLSKLLPDGSLHIVGENPEALITRLQVFIGNEEGGTLFVELTFFPDDLGKLFTIRRFIHFVENIKQQLQSDRYFVRFENASWASGALSPGSGVIFQSEDIKDLI